MYVLESGYPCFLLCSSFRPAGRRRQAVRDPAGRHPGRILRGKPVNLRSYKGKVVLLNFWASWCAPCRMEIPDFIILQREYKKRGFTIVGISMDQKGRDLVAEFSYAMKINYRCCTPVSGGGRSWIRSVDFAAFDVVSSGSQRPAGAQTHRPGAYHFLEKGDRKAAVTRPPAIGSSEDANASPFPMQRPWMPDPCGGSGRAAGIRY